MGGTDIRKIPFEQLNGQIAYVSQENYLFDRSIRDNIRMGNPNATDEEVKEAMRQAIANLSIKPELLLNDAVMIPGVDIKQVPIIKGDAKSISIGAASIIAKVTRDRLMAEYDELMPEYGFASNKGYGSAEHIAAIKKYGASPIHRMTFIKNFI